MIRLDVQGGQGSFLQNLLNRIQSHSGYLLVKGMSKEHGTRLAFWPVPLPCATNRGDENLFFSFFEEEWALLSYLFTLKIQRLFTSVNYNDKVTHHGQQERKAG